MKKKTLTYLGISLTLASCSNETEPLNQEEPEIKIEPVVKNNSQSANQWKEQLAELANSPDPTNLKFGAMCYMMATPYAKSYDCDRCKERTLFPKTGGKGREAGEFEKLSKQRAELEPLGLIVSIDSSCLCKNCGKNNDFYWEIANGEKTVRTKQEYFDFYILRDFLKKKNIVTGPTERQTPLKKHISRLKILLLGIEPTTK